MLSIFISWAIWNTRNNTIFQDIAPNVLLCGIKSISLFKDFFGMEKPKKTKVLYASIIKSLLAVGYFDRASSNDLCGCGMVLILNNDHIFNLRMGGGIESNTKA